MKEEPARCGCGGNAIAVLDWYPNIEPEATGTMYKVYCLHCGMTIIANTKEKAIEKWNTAMKYNDEFATIEGVGDLHYCGYCKADLPSAWIENYDYCPKCKKIFKNKIYE